MTIYLDIETIPTQDHELATHVFEGVELEPPLSLEDYSRPPKNWKDQDKIQQYIEQKKEDYNTIYLPTTAKKNQLKQIDELKKQSFSGLFGEVLCIGYAIDDGPVQCLYRDELVNDESVILEEFRRIATFSGRVNSYCDTTLVGHNAAMFDVPFLSQRMMINGMKPLFRHGSKPWDLSIEDTMLMWDCGSKKRASLYNLCIAFGIPSPKDGIDGSQVYQAFLDGRHSEIEDYCKRDVESTRALYKAMNKS